jgi:hypothetical protein
MGYTREIKYIQAAKEARSAHTLPCCRPTLSAGSLNALSTLFYFSRSLAHPKVHCNGKRYFCRCSHGQATPALLLMLTNPPQARIQNFSFAPLLILLLGYALLFDRVNFIETLYNLVHRDAHH